MSVLLFLAPLGAVSVLVLAASAALVALAAKTRLLDPQRWQTSWCVAGMSVLPALAGGLAAIALGVPRPLADCHCHVHGLHHPHLCAMHPELAAPLLWPAAGVIAAWAVAIVPGIRAVVHGLVETARLVEVARAAPAELVDGVPVRLLDLGAAKAFSVGVVRPLIVIDRSLWRALSADERRAVVHHERAHAERKDGVTLLGLRVLTALCPLPFGAALIDAWRGTAERACDLHAAAVVRDPSLVAEALLAVARARGSAEATGRSSQLVLGIAERSDLEARVLALLDGPQRAPELGNDRGRGAPFITPWRRF
jgi:Zn-dependent protease with chaperone function